MMIVILSTVQQRLSVVTIAGRPVSCKPLDSLFTLSDWTRHDCTACGAMLMLGLACTDASKWTDLT